MTAWATDINRGALNENLQVVDFVVTGNTNDSLFSVAPAVSAAGTLTYTPAAETTGSALITLNIHDGSGTANSGDDTGVSQSFTITVTVPSLSNGSFEDGQDPGGHTQLAVGATNLSPWSIISGSVDHIGGTWLASDLSRSIDLNGDAPGEISQTFDTVGGEVYEVLFKMAGNKGYWVEFALNEVTLEVFVPGTPLGEFGFAISSSTGSMDWVEKSYKFTASGTSSTLTFKSTTPGASGPALDDVRVNLIVS